jgi:hypothetical protein
MLYRQVIRDHIGLYWRYYAAAAVVLGLIAVFLHFVALRNRDRAAMRNWPVTKAQVVESETHEVSSGKYTLSTTVVVLLKLSYEVAGRTYVEPYTGTLPRNGSTDYDSLLAVGKSTEIRYSPSDPRVVSLYPIIPF